MDSLMLVNFCKIFNHAYSQPSLMYNKPVLFGSNIDMLRTLSRSFDIFLTIHSPNNF